MLPVRQSCFRRMPDKKNYLQFRVLANSYLEFCTPTVCSMNPTFSKGSIVCLFVLRLNIPVTNISVMSGGNHRFLGN